MCASLSHICNRYNFLKFVKRPDILSPAVSVAHVPWCQQLSLKVSLDTVAASRRMCECSVTPLYHSSPRVKVSSFLNFPMHMTIASFSAVIKGVIRFLWNYLILFWYSFYFNRLPWITRRIELILFNCQVNDTLKSAHKSYSMECPRLSATSDFKRRVYLLFVWCPRVD